MTRNQKIKTVGIGLSVLVAMGSTVLSLTGRTGPLTDAVNTLTYPFQKLSTALGDSLAALKTDLAEPDELRKQMDALESENRALRDRLDSLSELENENETLRAYLDVKESVSDYSLLQARVTGYATGDYRTVMTLNVGSKDGIALNQPVITPDGLLGKVTDVGKNWAQVTSVLSTSSAVGVYLSPSGVLGVLSGDLSLQKQNLALMTYLDLPAGFTSEQAAEMIHPGDLVLSTGVGSVYPKDLKVGTVDSIRLNPYDRTVEVLITPCVNLADRESLTHVTVLVPKTEPADTDTDMAGGETP